MKPVNSYDKESLYRIFSSGAVGSENSRGIPDSLAFTKERLEAVLGTSFAIGFRRLKYLERAGLITVNKAGINCRVEVNLLPDGSTALGDYMASLPGSLLLPAIRSEPVAPTPVAPPERSKLSVALSKATETKPFWPTVPVDLKMPLDESPAPRNGNALQLPEGDGSDSVIAVVDFDNVAIGAQKAGFNFSWRRLMEFIRSFGRVVLTPEVYLSPYAGRNNSIFGLLWAAGLKPIICPLRGKDRDDVDRKMMNEARTMIDLAGVTTLIIVSGDADFADLVHYAKNRRIKVVQINAADYRDNFEGVDAQPRLHLARTEGSLVRAIELLGEVSDPQKKFGSGSLPAVEEKEAIFVATVIKLLADRENKDKPEPYQLSFNRLCEAMGIRLNNIPDYRRVTAEKLRAALSELKNAGVLRRIEDQHLALTYYRLDQEHPVTVRALLQKSLASA